MAMQGRTNFSVYSGKCGVQSPQSDDNDYAVLEPRPFPDTLALVCTHPSVRFLSCTCDRSVSSPSDLFFKAWQECLEEGIGDQINDGLPGTGAGVFQGA